MSQNIDQIFVANPASSMVSTDLFYLGRSPYGITNDMAITWANVLMSIPGYMPTVNVTSATQTLVSNTRYINSNAAQVTYSLPASSVQGDVIEIVGTLAGAGGWLVNWTTNQYVVYNQNKGTTTTGSITAVNQYNGIRMVCTVANLAWNAYEVSGSLIVV